MISVVIPTHNPHHGRMAATLGALAKQTLPPEQWETIIVDNASSPAVALDEYPEKPSNNIRVVRVEKLGLTAARRGGIESAKGAFIVFVDDDNLLAPSYLEDSIRILEANKSLGAIGGKSIGRFDSAPADWQAEFLGMLALRDLGEAPIIAQSLFNPLLGRNDYPACAPIGAGMVLRAEAARHWSNALENDPSRQALDRTGKALVSGGDNDVIMTIMEGGWAVGYFPALSLQHIIPKSRLATDYLCRLNRAMMRSWMHVLYAHGANPWPRVSRASVPFRVLKAFLRHMPWKSPAHRVRFAGARGHFEGRATYRPHSPTT